MPLPTPGLPGELDKVQNEYDLMDQINLLHSELPSLFWKRKALLRQRIKFYHFPTFPEQV